MSQIASFDVFDTILTRAVGSPEAVFLMLGRLLRQKGWIDCSPEAFFSARVDAERRAHRSKGAACTLDDIYRELAVGLNLLEDQRTACIQAETEVEASLIRVIPGAAARLQRVRSQGMQVVFLSDMYLPSEYIRQRLIQHGLWEEGDALYCSCEQGKTKQTGQLFLDLLSIENVPPREVIHQGNSQMDDILPARRLGLQVDPFDEANLNHFEDMLETHRLETEGLTSVMAGASRLTRLCVPGGDSKQKALREIAAGVAAPTLTAYVLWVLNRARRLGLRRLYFLSRDGQVLMEIASRLVQKLEMDCDIRYLYGSRQSWNLPAVVTGSDEELAWIWDSPDLLSVRSLLARIGMQAEQVEDELQAAGLESADWARPLRRDELRALQRHLLTPKTHRLILQEAQEKRRVFIRYLEQEGALDGTPWGLVDLGWYGSMQNAISAVLLEAGLNPPRGFYFALYKGKISNLYAANREAYFFDQHLGLGYLAEVPDLIAMMEMFCVSNHGTVIDFKEQGERVMPVLKEEQNQRVIDWGLPVFRQAIFKFIENLILGELWLNPWADVRNAVSELLRTFWLQPTPEQVRAWADFPWEDGLGAETYWSPLAKAFDWQDVIYAIVRRQVMPHHRACWMQGSLMLSPPFVRLALKSIARFFHTYRSWRWRVLARLGRLKEN